MKNQMISGYFDYNATTPISDSVAQVMKDTIGLFANPSGSNEYSAANKDLINQSRDKVAHFLGTTASKIIFTSGGSEANNWAIKGTLLQYLHTPGHIVTTAIEHPSVLNTIKHCAETFGFEVTFVLPQANGAVTVEDMINAIRPDTQLVSMMYANNETGVLQPVKTIAPMLRERSIKFHVDGVQVVGKRKVDLEKLGVDYLSFSGHKFYGPKGTGGLYIRDVGSISPLIHGGGQELTLRSGTENLVGIVGLAKAAEEAFENLDLWDINCWECKSNLINIMENSHVSARFNGSTDYEKSISNTLNILIPGLRAEALAALLEAKHGIIVSIGSACSNNKTKKLSHVLKAMGMSERAIQGSIRVSVGRYTKQAHIQKFVNALESCTDQLLDISCIAQ